VQDDLNRKKFLKSSLEAVVNTAGKSANLNAKYYGHQQQQAAAYQQQPLAANNYQQPQMANGNYQQAYYNQMATGTQQAQHSSYLTPAQTYMQHQHQQQQQQRFGADKVAPLASMHSNMMPFMSSQQAAYDPNMQQMSKHPCLFTKIVSFCHQKLAKEFEIFQIFLFMLLSILSVRFQIKFYYLFIIV
jgi:hypothetical protein